MQASNIQWNICLEQPTVILMEEVVHKCMELPSPVNFSPFLSFFFNSILPFFCIFSWTVHFKSAPMLSTTEKQSPFMGPLEMI